MLRKFNYCFDSGPFQNEEEFRDNWQTGNCRRAVQYYFFAELGIFLNREQILCPELFHDTGMFIIRLGEPFSSNQLRAGDIIFAEKIRSRPGDLVDRSRTYFPNEEEYVVSLHTAIYWGVRGRDIWHATNITGSSCYWSMNRFMRHYRPVAAKRVVY